MATKKTTKVSLQSLVGKRVKLKDKYDGRLNGIFNCLAIDSGWILLEVNGNSGWWNMDGLSGIKEVPSDSQ